MPDNVEHLFGGTSLTRPRKTAPDALGSALLETVLAEVAALRVFARDQMSLSHSQNAVNLAQAATNEAFKRFTADVLASSAAQRVVNDEMQKFVEAYATLIEHVNQLGPVIADLDERLHALDGKFSVERPAAAVADAAQTEPSA